MKLLKQYLGDLFVRFSLLLSLSLCCATGLAQNPLNIGVTGDTLTLNWPGGEELLTSDDLTNWVAVPGATSPYTQAVTGSATGFFKLLKTPLVANNVSISATHAYVALGTGGLGVVNLQSRVQSIVPTVAGPSRVDDLSIDGDLLFTIDASAQGLSVYSLADPANPSLVTGPISAPSRTFSGVSAAAGTVVISGGTLLTTVRSYTPEGALGASVSQIDLGTGQPDALIAADGTRAFISTDFSGAGFGITIIDLLTPPATPQVRNQISLSGAGFTAGFQFPANFPIESALMGDSLLVAHGAGLAIINANTGALSRVVNLGFSANNVAVFGSTAYVTGIPNTGGGSRLAEVNLANLTAPVITEVRSFDALGDFTAVAVNERFIVIAANADGVLVLPR